MNIFIFGGTGDLAQRKLLPALYRHFKADRLSPQVKIYGIGSSSFDILSYQIEVENKLGINLESIEYDQKIVQKFMRHQIFDSMQYKIRLSPQKLIIYQEHQNMDSHEALLGLSLRF